MLIRSNGGGPDQLVGVGVEGVVEEAGDGRAVGHGLGRLGAEQALRQGRLRVHVDEQDPPAVLGEGAGEVVARRGLAAAALAVEHRDRDRPGHGWVPSRRFPRETDAASRGRFASKDEIGTFPGKLDGRAPFPGESDRPETDPIDRRPVTQSTERPNPVGKTVESPTRLSAEKRSQRAPDRLDVLERTQVAIDRRPDDFSTDPRGTGRDPAVRSGRPGFPGKAVRSDESDFRRPSSPGKAADRLARRGRLDG